MRRFVPILLAASILIGACADHQPPVSAAEKQALSKILDPKFLPDSVPTEREEDFYRVLAAFNAGRRPNEFISQIEFSSDHEADLWFSDGGMHGGGTAQARKKNGKWTIEQQMYFL